MQEHLYIPLSSALRLPPRPDGCCSASAGSVELRNALASKFSLELPSTLVFDYPNAQSLAKHLASSIVATNTTDNGPDAALMRQARVGGRFANFLQQKRQSVEPRESHAEVTSNLLLSVLSEMTQSVLGDPVRPSQPLMEAGLDSLGTLIT